MKLNVVFPWICVIALLAAAGSLLLSNQKKEADIAKLRADNQELQSAQHELEEKKNALASQTAETERLRKESADVLRLRNEVRQLRDDKQKLSTDMQKAQTAAERAVSQAQAQAAAAAQQQEQAQRAQAEAAARAGTTGTVDAATQTMNSCINQLRQIDGAKQQWALENGKTAESVPTTQELAVYLSNKTMPACPSGGTYTINAVNVPPACTIPNHVLPK